MSRNPRPTMYIVLSNIVFDKLQSLYPLMGNGLELRRVIKSIQKHISKEKFIMSTKPSIICTFNNLGSQTRSVI